jgi:putative phosphoribosyl transferase
MAMLLFDLLSPGEKMAPNRGPVFDIRLLADRLIDEFEWVNETLCNSITSFGLFGASTGAAAAHVAAAELGDRIKAAESRGGQPHLSGEALADVTAPTLPIVGGRDHGTVELNQKALGRLRRLASMLLFPGATHLFEEPDAMDKVTILAQDWLECYPSSSPVKVADAVSRPSRRRKTACCSPIQPQRPKLRGFGAAARWCAGRCRSGKRIASAAGSASGSQDRCASPARTGDRFGHRWGRSHRCEGH